MLRTVDDHDFKLALQHDRRSSCRIQLFEDVDQRPIGIATQTMSPDGVSLTNAAEQFAAVWQRYLPHTDQPLRWIEHYQPRPDQQLHAGRPHWLKVEFVSEPGRNLSSPAWRGCDLLELAELVGGPIDPSRGDYEPAPSPPPGRCIFVLVPVLQLPLTDPFRARACMPSGSGVLHRYWRRLRPLRGPRSCGWYHGGDWRNVTRQVADVLGPDARSGVEVDDDFRDELVRRLCGRLSGEWEARAASSLLLDPLAAAYDGWENGQHRAQAMIDAGCRHALLERWVAGDVEHVRHDSEA